MTACPCCGAPVRAAVPLDAVPDYTGMTPTEAQLFAILAARPGRRFPTFDIAEKLYRDDPDGGPEDATKVIKVHVNHMRPKAAKLGWGIDGYKGGDGGGYTLVTAP